jgi:hypothetical protein
MPALHASSVRGSMIGKHAAPSYGPPPDLNVGYCCPTHHYLPRS